MMGRVAAYDRMMSVRTHKSVGLSGVTGSAYNGARARPSFQDGLNHSRQRDGKEHPPETPQPAKYQHGCDNSDRVQIDHFGKQQRYQQITV